LGAVAKSPIHQFTQMVLRFLQLPDSFHTKQIP
jgi:hypothetical protein